MKKKPTSKQTRYFTSADKFGDDTAYLACRRDATTLVTVDGLRQETGLDWLPRAERFVKSGAWVEIGRTKARSLVLKPKRRNRKARATIR